MPANTPVLALPYPVPADTADVPRDIKALADRLELLAGKIVTSLPGSPADGQQCLYLADAAAGIVWALRYRAASASAYKWEAVGGGRLRGEVPTFEALSSNSTWLDPATVGPQLTAPLAGDYDITFTTQVQASGTAGQASTAAPKLGAAVVSDNDRSVTSQPVTGATFNAVISRQLRRTVAAGTVVKLQYFSAAPPGGALFGYRELLLSPVRVG